MLFRSQWKPEPKQQQQPEERPQQTVDKKRKQTEDNRLQQIGTKSTRKQCKENRLRRSQSAVHQHAQHVVQKATPRAIKTALLRGKGVVSRQALKLRVIVYWAIVLAVSTQHVASLVCSCIRPTNCGLLSKQFVRVYLTNYLLPP